MKKMGLPVVLFRQNEDSRPEKNRSLVADELVFGGKFSSVMEGENMY